MRTPVVKRPPRKARLTTRLLATLQPEPVAYPVWDSTLPGFAIRVQPTGSMAWYAVYSRRGTVRWLHLGNAAVIDVTDARKLAAEQLLQVATGRDPVADKRAQRGAGTFAELATGYVERHAKRHNKSWRQAQKLVTRFLLPVWGKLPAASITRTDVKAMLSGIAAPSLANQVQASGSAIFSWAIKEEVAGIAANPFRGVDSNPTVSRERVLADSEVPLFWNAFDGAGLIRSSALKLILLCGQRPGEVAHMRWSDIVDGWWQLPGAADATWPGTKNGQSHRIWLSAAVQAILAELSDDRREGYVFPGVYGGAVKGLDAAMRNICAGLKIDRATPHDLRRTFSSKVTALGFGRDAMNRVTNHREGGITDVYDRFKYEVENKKIMESVASKIMTLANNDVGKVIPFVR
jgi:integrase